MHLPNAHIELKTIAEHDDSDIQFAVRQNVDIVIVSLTRRPEDIDEAKATVKNCEKQARVYARIENHEGLQNFEDILAVADGIVIARQPLSLELSAEKVYIAQQWMLEKANQVAKPVIIQSHILDSMVNNPRPSRPEASDVCQTVINGADGIMLF